MSTPHTQALRPGARTAFACNAALAGVTVVLVLVFTLFDAFGPLGYTPDPGLFGPRPAGWGGVAGRMLDAVSYFTLWSNAVVAVAMTIVARHPVRDAPWQWALRTSALIMITVTAIVYATLIAPWITLAGWSLLTNPMQHIVVPIVTVLVWLIWGPHGQIRGPVVLGSLLVPFTWIVLMLARGAIDGTYPYGFVNVTAHGYPAVLAAAGMILVFGLVLALIFWGLDALLARPRKRPATGEPEA